MDIVSKFNKMEIQIPVRRYLDDDFLHHFNNIFKYNDKSINVIGTVNQPWFLAKDVLDILGYSSDRKNIHYTIKKVSANFKKSYEELHQNKEISVSSKSLDTETSYNLETSNKNKEIYINEPGLYFIIMRSKLKSAEQFQAYVYEELLPGIRKIVQKRYEDELNKKEDKIDQLQVQVKQLIDQNNETHKQNNETQKQNMTNQKYIKHLVEQNNKLIEQNNKALEKLDETNEKLDESNEIQKELEQDLCHINDKLDTVMEDRNISPFSQELQHEYALLKSINNDKEYMFIRGQNKYINSRLKNYASEYKITIDKTKTPNPIDLVNRLKDKIEKLNYIDLSVVRNTKDYKTANPVGKRQLVSKYKDSNTKIRYRLNKITLVNYTEKQLLELMKELDDEKYM